MTIIEKKPEASQSTKDWLNDISISLSHRARDKLNLFDLYVPCDLKVNEYSSSIEDDIDYISSKKLISEGYYLITGEEQQGKTSLLKYIYSEAGKLSYPSIFLNEEDLKSSSVDSILEKAFYLQYDNYCYDAFLESNKKILLIDNINNVKLNDKHLSLALSHLKTIFNHIIITCSDTYAYNYQDIAEFSDFSILELLGMGHSKREELIEKWVSLGKEESIDDETLYSTCDEFKIKLNAIIRKNIVPPKPVYVLILLQMFEAYSKQNLELTSYGHCYQQLVYQSLSNAKVPNNEFGKYINVLTELAWEIHLNNGSLVSSNLNLFFTKYQDMYLSVNFEIIVDKLMSNSILINKNNRISFKYPYIFYFFIAKKIAESYSKDKSIETEFKKLLSMLHKENYANILVFVTHHTKEPWILNEINNTLVDLFKEQSIATLSKDQLGFMADFISNIQKLVLETTKKIKEERKKVSDNLDEMEKKEIRKENKNITDNNTEEEEEEEEPDILVKINKTFKGMEVTGQIIRNRYAELTKNDLLNLANNSSSAGLRFLNYFIELSDNMKKEITNLIKNAISIEPDITNEQLEKRSTTMFMHMTYSVINAVVKKTATSVGSKEATEIYKKLEVDSGYSPAMILLNQAIDLEFRKSLDIVTLKETVIKLKQNPVCLRILKEMIILHVYMFPVGYKEKQQISELLDLSTKSQRIMDSKKIGKG
ncbi:TPA: NACHT domain-containing protein [Yersinia enterocolitica]